MILYCNAILDDLKLEKKNKNLKLLLKQDRNLKLNFKTRVIYKKIYVREKNTPYPDIIV